MEDFDIDQVIKQEFILESKELLEDLESGLLQLEKDPSDAEVVGGLFRVAHTIKGSGYAAKFDHLASLAHVFENLLGLVRSGVATCDLPVSDALLAGADKLKEYVHALEDNHDARLDIENVVAMLEKEIFRFDKSATHTPDPAESSGGFGFFDDDEDEEATQKDSESTSDGPSMVVRRAAHLHHIDHIDIILVDDDDQIRELLREILELEFGEHISIREAEDGPTGLALYEEKEPDLIITDLKMPGMDGLEFLENVRAKNGKLPAIMISGHAGRDHIVRLIKIGVYDFIDKPFDADLINLAVRNAVRISKIQSGLLELANLNFSTYLLMQRLMSGRGKISDDKAKSIESDLKSKLDTIAMFTNRLLKER